MSPMHDAEDVCLLHKLKMIEMTYQEWERAGWQILSLEAGEQSVKKILEVYISYGLDLMILDTNK